MKSASDNPTYNAEIAEHAALEAFSASSARSALIVVPGREGGQPRF
jgi:hypothetical protein